MFVCVCVVCLCVVCLLFLCVYMQQINAACDWESAKHNGPLSDECNNLLNKGGDIIGNVRFHSLTTTTNLPFLFLQSLSSPFSLSLSLSLFSNQPFITPTHKHMHATTRSSSTNTRPTNQTHSKQTNKTNKQIDVYDVFGDCIDGSAVLDAQLHSRVPRKSHVIKLRGPNQCIDSRAIT